MSPMDQAKVDLAREVAHEMALETIEFRNQALVSRAEAIESAPTSAKIEAFSAQDLEAVEMAAMGPRALGTLLAEGDSWFDYPFFDVLNLLEDEHGYEVESVAHRGDRLEDMAYSGGQLNEFTRLLEKLLRRGEVPRAILLSGGGNDIAGDEFGFLINHASSPIAGPNESIVRGVIDERLRYAYLTMILALTEIAELRIGTRIPILVHGYDHPVPDGRGYLGGWWVLPGPWLEPGFREKGFRDPNQTRSFIGDLIDRFNDMLAEVAASFDHVGYLDLRQVVNRSTDYRDDWGNELHPTREGFERVAQAFAQEIQALP